MDFKLESSNFELRRQQCIESGTLFEDPDFTATDKSLFFSHPADRHYEWLRPHDICNDPQFFVKGFSRFDVQQGELGDCWFLAATANLTQNDKLFYQVVCEDNSFEENYAGICHFRFWHFGKWVEVVVDDRLPTYRGRLMYMHSKDKNEFWSALLEKAYAKLQGSYEALKGGTSCEALQDFTGGFTEMYDLKKAPSNIYQIIEKEFERNSMMACAIEPDPRVVEAETPQGLVCGHSYSLTKIKLVDIVTPRKSGKIQLLRLRNPWGKVEWRGAWSDQSPEWSLITDDVKAELGLTCDQDGEFWMSFRDFLRYFDRLEICSLSPDLMTDEIKRKWNMNVFEGKWIAGLTAGGCRNYIDTFHRNPQYVMKIEDPDEDDDDGNCLIAVALLQKNRRNKGIDCLPIGFVIYNVNEDTLEQKPVFRSFFETNASVARSPAFVNMRETSSRFKLTPGHYLVVPSTYEPNEEAEFMIRIFSETSHTFHENDDRIAMEKIEIGKVQHTRTENLEYTATEKLFAAVAGDKKEINWMELKQILNNAMHEIPDFQGFSKETCRSMVAMLDTDYSGTLNLPEFKILFESIEKWKTIFNVYDYDRSNKLSSFELRDALQSAGYRLNVSVLKCLVFRYGGSDKNITFEDFIMCAVKLKTTIEHFAARDYNNSNSATFTIDEWIATAVCS